jgi:hypothetical protein
VGAQRSKKDRLTSDRLKRLNLLGFSWDPIAEVWDQNLAALKKFHKHKGHCQVEIGHEVDGLKLGLWVSGQRSKKDRLTPDQLKRLNSLSFSWDPIAEVWEQNFAALKKFCKREGHCCVATRHQADGLKLGLWVKFQRRKKDRLTPDQLKRLNSLGFSWDPIAGRWDQYFTALQKFRKHEGHCRVKKGRQVDGLKLGVWAQSQRLKKESLRPDQLKRLSSLGFSWDPYAELWEQNFAALQKFRKREGHCRVEKGREVDGLKLGLWVSGQRSKKDRLTPDRLKRLNSLGFSWDPHAEQWEQNFAALKKFCKREGHCYVAAKHQADGLKLGLWMSAQRSKKDMLSADQIKRLNSLGFIWDPIAEQWEQSFTALQEFLKREGHCRVPEPYQANGLKLGVWVGSQRSRKDRLSPDRLKRLNSLGFVWRK